MVFGYEEVEGEVAFAPPLWLLVPPFFMVQMYGMPTHLSPKKIHLMKLFFDESA
jgi:hypothetical protein